MCNSGKDDCSTRGGAAFQIPFIDDLDKSIMDKWDVGGTPTYFLIQPDGIVAWASHESDETFPQAIYRIVYDEYIVALHPQINAQGGE